MIADSLMQQDDGALKQVGWVLAWLFSCSGNTLIDFDDESMMEIQPLSWEAEDVAFAVELIKEADGIIQEVKAGLKQLQENLALIVSLSDNVNEVYEAIAWRKDGLDTLLVSLKWSHDFSTKSR